LMSNNSMSLFEKRSQLPRREFREILKKTDIKIGSGRGLNTKQRVRIEEDVFPKRQGETLSKRTFDRGINQLKKRRFGEADIVKKSKITKKIKYLENLEKMDGI